MIGRGIKYLKDRFFTLYCQLLGANISHSSRINYRSEITFKKNLNLKKESIIYKNSSIYIAKNGSFEMGSQSHVAPYGYFLVENNKIHIGDHVGIGPYCSFFCSSNHYSAEEPLFVKNYLTADIYIGNNVFIGAQTVILPGTTIGDNCIVAANSVASGKLEAGYIYSGSPCKPVKKVGEK